MCEMFEWSYVTFNNDGYFRDVKTNYTIICISDSIWIIKAEIMFGIIYSNHKTIKKDNIKSCEWGIRVCTFIDKDCCTNRSKDAIIEDIKS
jgi:hypothetical protein